MRKALITGSEGFTGKYLAAELENHGWEVWRTDNLNLPDGDRYRKSDLCEPVTLKRVIDEIKPDAVVHLAAIAFVGHEDPGMIYRVNLIGSRNLLALLSDASHKPSCVLLASSANIYGNAASGTLDETTPVNPTNDYAVSKLAMEFMAQTWKEILPIVIVRPFNYTGVGQSESFLIPKIVKHFRLKEKVIELGNLDVWRDYSDVRSVVRAYRRLLEVCPISETVNVCSGNSYSLREILAMMEAMTGQKIQVRINPAFIRQNEVNMLSGDPSKLLKLIGDWDAPSLEKTLSWMLSEGAVQQSMDKGCLGKKDLYMR